MRGACIDEGLITVGWWCVHEYVEINYLYVWVSTIRVSRSCLIELDMHMLAKFNVVLYILLKLKIEFIKIIVAINRNFFKSRHWPSLTRLYNLEDKVGIHKWVVFTMHKSTKILSPGHKRENYRGEEIDAIFDWLETGNNFFEFYYNGKKGRTAELSEHMERCFGSPYSQDSLKHKLHNIKALYRWIEKYFVTNAGPALDNDTPEEIVAKKERKMRGYIRFHKLETDFRQSVSTGSIIPGKYMKSNGFTPVPLKYEQNANQEEGSSSSYSESPLGDYGKPQRHGENGSMHNEDRRLELEQKTVSVRERRIELSEKRIKEAEKWEPIVQQLRDNIYKQLHENEEEFPQIPAGYLDLLKFVDNLYNY